MKSSSYLSETLAQFAIQTTYEDIPANVIQRTKYLFLDAIGIAFASTRYEFAKAGMLALGGLNEGANIVIGMPMTLSLRDAVLMNGALIHGLDFDDTYLSGQIHLTSSAVPCALGVGAHAKVSGQDMLAAAAIGMETAARLALPGKGSFVAAGFHPTSVVGIFGCTLITSKLWKMNVAQAVLAQGIALSTASGSMQPMHDGSWSKRLHPGSAAASSITATALARQGYVSPKDCYEGTFGLYSIFLGGHAKSVDYSLITGDLGKTWEFSKAAIKLFPAGHQTHPFMNAAIKLAHEQTFKLDDIQSVKALTAKEGVTMVCEPLEDKRAPKSSYSAEFSLPYLIARCLVRGKFDLSDLEESALRDPKTLELAKKIGYEIDPNAGYPKFRSGEIVVTLKNGEQLKRRENIMPEDLIQEEDIRKKFISNAELVMSPARAKAICNAVLSLEDEPDVNNLSAILKAP